jgi:hypothetical protein
MARGLRTLIIAAGTIALTGAAHAQSLGTFRWQLQPFCNVVTLAVTQNGGVFRLEGTDDQCGAGADLVSVIGTAFQNPDGTIGFGLNIVGTPGVAVPVEVAITVPSLSGTWRDGAGNTGGFVLTPGAGTGGSPRPLPVPVVPVAIQLRPDGGFLAGGTQGVGTIPASGAGVRLMWHPAKAAIRAGRANGPFWDEERIGLASAAFGENTQAPGRGSVATGITTLADGRGSTAMGGFTHASADNSTAMGQSTLASGFVSTAMGQSTVASGQSSTTMGSFTTASGLSSTAIGNGTDATGDFSVAIGSFARATATGKGSFVFGDRSTALIAGLPRIEAFIPNQFLARAAGGVGFYTNASLTAGVTLAAGGSAWLTVSDVRMKSHFRDLSGEDVLSKLATMPIREWSYNAQDASIRHVGPTAQDFFAAFGLGEDPLRISTIDADGIALAAVRALDARTRTQVDESQRLRDEDQRLRDENRALVHRLEHLESALEAMRVALGNERGRKP